MKLLHFFQLLLLVTSTLFISCTKDSPEDPRFSCKINGELWNPKDGNYSFGLTANYDYQPDIGRDIFTIYASQYKHTKYIEVSIDFLNPKIGLQTPLPSHVSLTLANLSSYFLDTTLYNKIILTQFDAKNRITEGKFEGYLYNVHDISSERINITDGEFKVNF